IVEHVDATEEERAIADTNAGFYAIRLGHLRAGLATLKSDNKKGELYLTDLVALAAARGGATAIDAPFDEVAGINDRVDLAAVDAAARKKINERWMREGVSFADPATAYLDADVGPIGQDAWIGANVHLRGKTSIGANARVDTGCVLADVQVAAGAHLKPFT